MTALTPIDAASCRAMAVECGRRANGLRAFPGRQMALIERARELCLLALKFEDEEQHLPSGAGACAADSPARSISSPISSGTNPPFAAPAVPHTTTPSSESPEGETPLPLSGTNSSEVTA